MSSIVSREHCPVEHTDYKKHNSSGVFGMYHIQSHYISLLCVYTFNTLVCIECVYTLNSVC